MNVKTFTIVDTESNRTKEIKSTATTVAELKRDLRQQGFNVDGKTIQEALTRTEFKDDSSILPHDVPYKGGITNDLVFRLTKTNKQVRSGINNRAELYVKIKKLDLAQAVKDTFGRNFTQVGTAELEAFIDRATKKAAKNEVAVKEEVKSITKEAQKEVKIQTPCKEGVDMIKRLCNILLEIDLLSEEDVNKVLGQSSEDSSTEEDNFCNEDIEDIEDVNDEEDEDCQEGPKFSRSELDSLFSGM
jgi:hypothetical protein